MEISWEEWVVYNGDGANEQQDRIEETSTSARMLLWPDHYSYSKEPNVQHSCDGNEMNARSLWLEAQTGIWVYEWLEMTELRSCISLRRWRALARIGLHNFLCFTAL